MNCNPDKVVNSDPILIRKSVCMKFEQLLFHWFVGSVCYGNEYSSGVNFVLIAIKALNTAGVDDHFLK